MGGPCLKEFSDKQQTTPGIESDQDGGFSLHCRKILELNDRFDINRAEDIAVAMGIHPEYARELMRKIGLEA